MVLAPFELSVIDYWIGDFQEQLAQRIALCCVIVSKRKFTFALELRASRKQARGGGSFHWFAFYGRSDCPEVCRLVGKGAAEEVVGPCDK